MADEPPVDGVIPPQASTSAARGRDVLLCAKAAQGFCLSGWLSDDYVGGIKRKFECFLGSLSSCATLDRTLALSDKANLVVSLSKVLL